MKKKSFRKSGPIVATINVEGIDAVMKLSEDFRQVANAIILLAGWAMRPKIGEPKIVNSFNDEEVQFGVNYLHRSIRQLIEINTSLRNEVGDLKEQLREYKDAETHDIQDTGVPGYVVMTPKGKSSDINIDIAKSLLADSAKTKFTDSDEQD